MKKYLILAVLGINLYVFAQPKTIEGYELGIDGFVSASNQGGAFGLGPKFGFRLNDNLILGPSFRWQRTWNSAFSQTFNYSIWGGGAFLHARYKNVLFGGFEIEMLKSPVSYTAIAPPTNWIPTVFICGGFSKEWNHIIRLNAGLYYDVVNHVNSPFRTAYFMTIKNAQSGAIQKYVPLIYRISFFFPLDRPDKNKANPTEEIVPEEETY
jgi:hypothetical protein